MFYLHHQSKQKELPIINAPKSYLNIHFNDSELKSYAAGTQFDGFYESDRLFHSEFVVLHTSDYLQYLSLFRSNLLGFGCGRGKEFSDILSPNVFGALNAVTVTRLWSFNEFSIGYIVMR